MGSLAEYGDLGGGVSVRGGGGVGTLWTANGGRVCTGDSEGGGGRGGGDILRGRGSFASKFAMGMAGPVPTLWRTSETRGSVGERCGLGDT